MRPPRAGAASNACNANRGERVPARVIRAEINASESLARVSIGADLMFRALLVAVDDYGRFDARPQILRARLFPMREELTSAEVAAWLAELCAGEKPPIRLYEANSKPHLYLTGWRKHRSNSRRAKDSLFPAPPVTCEDADRTDTELRDSSGSVPEDPGASRRLRECPGDPPAGDAGDAGSEGVAGESSATTDTELQADTEGEREGESSPAAPPPPGAGAPERVLVAVDAQKRGKPAKPPPPAWSWRAAKDLEVATRRRWPGALIPESFVGWARALAGIRAGEAAVVDLLRWYCDPARDGPGGGIAPYTPEVRSGAAFAEKWNQLVAARGRDGRDVRRTSPGERILESSRRMLKEGW